MTDLHETSDPKYTASIDTLGWIFVAFTVVVSILAYHGSDTMIANSLASHVVGSAG